MPSGAATKTPSPGCTRRIRRRSTGTRGRCAARQGPTTWCRRRSSRCCAAGGSIPGVGRRLEGAPPPPPPPPPGGAVDVSGIPPPPPPPPGAVGRRGRGERVPYAPESLGTRQIEGLTASGTRRTEVIPAGRIGNDRPIEITDERWVSADLKVLVLSKHHDPRTGEVEYRLTNVTRIEPPRELFLPASDYTITDAPPPPPPAPRRPE